MRAVQNNMPYFEPVNFSGALSGYGLSVPIAFTAGIDDEGLLEVVIERLPTSREALNLYPNREVGEQVDFLTLEGRSNDGWSIRSDHFTITHLGIGSDEGRELEYQGHCADAELKRTVDKPVVKSRRLWFVRQLRAVHALKWSSPLGSVVAGGPADLSSLSQQPSGAIQLEHPSGEADDAWWSEAERFMTHIARVLSFGCDAYLLPVMEQKIHGCELTWRVVRRGRTAAPFLAPFHVVHMEPIFKRACDSFTTHSAEVEELDPAIRWLTAPVALWEQRLINGMTALECIIERTAPDGTRLFTSGSSFKKLAKKVRALLTSEVAPDGMLLKLPDLNRRPVKEQLTALLEHREIYAGDFPAGWFDEVLKARNLIVHTGVAPVTETESNVTFEQIVWAREIVTRLLLDRIGFVGPYQSWLHKDKAIHFPECKRMDVWAAKQVDAIPAIDG
jgi:hypothetical protein